MDKILAVIDVIESHLTENVSVETIAQRCGYSRHYLHRQFKHATGLSISQYQRCRLLSLAAKQLGESDQRILDIAVEAGFESQEAFARAFKRFAFVAPKNLRQQPVWAERLLFSRLDAALLHQLAVLRDCPANIHPAPARRWACYAIRQDNLHRTPRMAHDVQQGVEAFFRQPFAQPFMAFPYVIMELNEHHQYASSTFPLAIAFAVNADTPLPSVMFEVHQPARMELHISMPSIDYIPALYYHLAVRMGTDPALQRIEAPTLWHYSDDKRTFHANFGLHDTAIPASHSQPELVHLPPSTVPVHWHTLPRSKWAGTRRLHTLWSDYTKQIKRLMKAECSSRLIAFGDPAADPNQQYRVAFSETAEGQTTQTPPDHLSTRPLNIGGTFLRTVWEGKNIFELENAIERFYGAMHHDPHFYYAPGPELIRNLTIENDQIAFELLTPVKSRRGG
ncbi:AraC family transcriptional regulator [Photobacterium japonica]|uniref:helix-turn-helix transcriptional regulator n=1 Tax=Photobacterium japonica TaxID=2910235 RepID=UPI003D121B97